ncbi:HNH endonuclease [Haloarcula sp. Atlit-120R]|uniref:HNH endonuclease n=1 Tax=Haloarcula sp. Atlit-120R TaxID=2282135 RepID=UPI000EF2942E|nr:HNH endonuclease [Haloarcula sp. Atlit-120R]RLM32635.1 HNH endonuclease [Haloarcula sp. Atlit-120R]
MTSECFICGDHRPNSLETHHVVPKRYGGSDKPENLVGLCASCHSAIEKLYDDSFYQRLGIEATENESADLGLDVEGTELKPTNTKDRDFHPQSPHVSTENWCLEMTFYQFISYSPDELISGHFPESEHLENQLTEDEEEVISFFKTHGGPLRYWIFPEKPRETPPVAIVLNEIDSEDLPEIASGGQRSIKTDEKLEITSEFQRYHCGYCHSVYTEEEKADLAAHLRVKHRIENPYGTDVQNNPDEYGLLDDNMFSR